MGYVSDLEEIMRELEPFIVHEGLIFKNSAMGPYKVYIFNFLSAELFYTYYSKVLPFYHRVISPNTGNTGKTATVEVAIGFNVPRPTFDEEEYIALYQWMKAHRPGVLGVEEGWRGVGKVRRADVRLDIGADLDTEVRKERIAKTSVLVSPDEAWKKKLLLPEIDCTTKTVQLPEHVSPRLIPLRKIG